ncbi:hypothetical protein D046_2999A, partial [Vibrio parahaemolyticus V-223/04]
MFYRKRVVNDKL